MIEKEELITVLPHRERMLMLDKVRFYDLKEKFIEAEYLITSDCLFFDSKAGGVPAWVGFEFIAQAISAYTGIDYRERGEPPKIGFILGISRMKISVPFFDSGTALIIRAKEVERMDSFYIYEGEIFKRDNKVLEGKITVMDVDEKTALSMRKEY